MNDVFKQTGHPSNNTRASLLKLDHPLRKTNHGQNTLSYIAPNIWYSLPDSLKATKGLNTYKRKVKKHFLDRMKNKESNVFVFF